MSALLVFTLYGAALPLALKRMEEKLAVPTLIITPCHSLLPIPFNFAVPGMANPPPSWPTIAEVDSLITLHSVTVYIDLMALRPSPMPPAFNVNSTSHARAKGDVAVDPWDDTSLVGL